MDTNKFRRLMWFAVVIVLLACLMGCDMMPCPAEEVNVDAVIEIESGGNPNVYNKSSGAIGLMQITPICLEEYDKYWNKGIKITHPKELYNKNTNLMVGSWYLNTRIPQMLKAYEIPDTIKNRLIAYHDGIGNLKKYIEGRRKLGPEMRAYLKRYHKLTKGR